MDLTTQLPKYVIDNILTKIETQSFSTFTPQPKEIQRMEYVMEMYQNLQKFLKSRHVVLGGCYVAHLEGLTHKFNHVSFYVVLENIDDENDEMPFINKHYFSSMLAQKGTFKGEIAFFHSYCVGWRFFENVRFSVEYARHSIEYKINFLYPRGRVASWTEAARYVLALFPLKIDAVALTPDGNQLVRFEQATLRLHTESFPYQYLYMQRREYIQRIKHFGKPSTLLQLAWGILQPTA